MSRESVAEVLNERDEMVHLNTGCCGDRKYTSEGGGHDGRRCHQRATELGNDFVAEDTPEAPSSPAVQDQSGVRCRLEGKPDP